MVLWSDELKQILQRLGCLRSFAFKVLDKVVNTTFCSNNIRKDDTSDTASTTPKSGSKPACQ